jgi:hypothetical protein
MKIAICLRGCMSKIKSGSYKDDLYKIYDNNLEYINFNSVFNSIKTHIIDSNIDCSFDFFIQSWNPDLEISLNKLYKPKDSLYENQLNYKILIENNKVKSYAYTAQLLGISKSIKLMINYSKINKIIYDYVIIYRPDVLLYKDLKLNKYNKNEIYVNDSIKEDFHFIMNQNNAEKLSNIFNTKLTIYDFVKKNIHQELLADDIKCGINQEVLRKLKFACIDRHNIPIENFYKYGLTDKEIELLTHI